LNDSPENSDPTSSDTTAIEPLAQLVAQYGVAAADDQLALLDRYREQLWSWNEKLNLTRHTTLEKFVTRDVLDSWELCKLLDGRRRVLDVGTGGGVPGLVMAILRPNLSVSVSESTAKKARVVEAIVGELQLPVEVYACRAEEVLQIRTFDSLVARGVAPLPKLLKWLQPYWDAFDELLVIKGAKWADERNEARHLGLLRGLELRIAATYQARDTGVESVILRLWRPD
jgi:16S rRNA (guanine527-N7)-methyltransferase